MDGLLVSEILNAVLGGSLVGAIISIVTIRSALKKARAEAEKALAESETVKITNAEQATRILVENIVNPLREELNETRKELSSVKREIARFRKAVDGANSCRYRDGCPVLERMRLSEKDEGCDGVAAYRTTHGRDSSRQRRRGHRDSDDVSGDGADVVGESDDSDGQPP